MTPTTAYRLKVLGGLLAGLLVVVTVVSLMGGSREAPPASPTAQSTPAEAPPAAAPETAAPAVSRSRGQTEWAFFFRPGDTLSRMDGTPLGVVARLERQHTFPDGSTGPAYVVRSADKQESAFDADELERRARIETIRDIRIPPARAPDAPTTR